MVPAAVGALSRGVPMVWEAARAYNAARKYGPQAYAAANLIGGAYQRYKSRKRRRGSADSETYGASRRGSASSNRAAGTNTTAAGGTGPNKYYSKKHSNKTRKLTKKGLKRANKKLTKKNKIISYTKCSRLGFNVVQQIVGYGKDTEVVHIMTSSYPPVSLLELWVATILRKLVKKGLGFECQQLDREINSMYASAGLYQSQNLRIELLCQNKSDGVYSNYIYDTVAGDSIKDIVGDAINGVAASGSVFMDRLKLYCAGDGFGSISANVITPLAFNLYKYEPNVGAFWGLVASIQLDNIKVHMYSKCEMKVQNRTAPGNANTSGDDVAQNPLQGTAFEFSSDVPKPRIDGQWRLEQQIQSLGHQIQIGTGAGGTSAAGSHGRMVPTKNVFKNCETTHKILINPGEVEWYNFKTQDSGDFLKLLGTKLRIGTQGVSTVRSGIGKCQMLSFEDVINIDAGSMFIAYELTRTMGCYITTSSKTESQPFVTKQTYSIGT